MASPCVRAWCMVADVKELTMVALDISILDTGLDAKGDELALCQLGGATALLWAKIPSKLQDELLHMAESVAGVPHARFAAARIQGLIERNAQRY